MSERREHAGPGSAEALRVEFDAAFARPARPPEQDVVALLALRVGGEPVAIRVAETAGLVAARRIEPVPSRRAELLGICGVRGQIVPVFSLARLLGRVEEGEPRWIVLVGTGAERIGLSAAEFERHLRVPTAEIRPAAPGGGADVLHADGEARPILSIQAIWRDITGR
jgi:chemotaxis signal transduction protein